ncbi:MAG: hypothetical protein E7G73_02095 [Peptostreptococcus sp.]|nr:hypothetical protein [Peptostreptococcus sp.]
MNMGNRSFKLKCENLAAISGRIRLRYRGICHITSHYNQLMEDIYDVYYVKYVKINSITETILVEYDSSKNVEIDEVIDVINNIVAKYSLEVYKGYIESKMIEGAGKYENVNESSRKLLVRLLINGGVILGTRLLPSARLPLYPMSRLANFTTVPALTSLALTSPLLKTSWDGLVETKRPNADFLTVTSIVASIMLGNSISALTIIALSDIAEFMTSYTVERTRNSIKKLLSVE